jgi:hypothetical protein
MYSEALRRELTACTWTAPTFEVVDYLPLPDGYAEQKTFDMSSPGRPLKGENLRRTTTPSKVTDYLPVPVGIVVCAVEHRIFGPGIAFGRTLLDNGSSAVFVVYDCSTIRSLLIDAAYWVTPIEVLMRVEIQPADTKFEYGPPRLASTHLNYCSPVVPFVAVEPRAWSDEEERARLHVEPRQPKFTQATPEDVAWAKREPLAGEKRRLPDGLHTPLAPALSAEFWIKRYEYQAEFAVKNATRANDVPGLRRSAREYWKFCVAFEFPKVCDQAAMETASKRLVRELPAEHLDVLTKDFARRGLLVHTKAEPVSGDGVSNPPGKRNYVLGKRGKRDEL